MRHVALGIIVLSLLYGGEVHGLLTPAVGDTVVGVSLFISEGCHDCEVVEETLIPQLKQRFGRGLQIQYHVIENEEEYALMVTLEQQLGQVGHDIPMAVVGRHILGGRQALMDSLATLILMALAQGGVGFPTVEEVERPVVFSSGRRIYVAYFYTPGCKQCDRVTYLLNHMQRRYSNMEIRRYSMGDRENVALHEAIAECYGVPEVERLLTPSLFIGEVHLVEHAITDQRVQEVLDRVQVTGTRCPWEDAEAIGGQVQGQLVARFRSWGPWAVIVAGLIDGVNPCAFPTLIFFISYLSFVGRQGRDLIFVGAAFTVAVFLTYFLVGIGAFHFIQSLRGFSLLSRILYIAIALLALTLGVLSFRDFIKARRGELGEATLQLPTFLKRRIHQTIRMHMRVRRFVLAALASGMIVSLLELACTGQVYLPTICFVVGVPAMRAHAILYLGLYNLMFVVPLILVFVLAYVGVSSGRLAEWTQRHVAFVKLLMGLLFFALAGLLISTVV